MKKIMFNDKFGLTKAVLEGRKTQTRRIVPQSAIQRAIKYQEEYYNGALERIDLLAALNQLYFVEKILKLPYVDSEVVAIAQSYKDCGYNGDCEKAAGWNNKMFANAWLMLHHILIKRIRIERLRDISNEDCLAEGIYQVNGYSYKVDGMNFVGDDPKFIYSALIDKIAGKGTWDKNPFVFVYDFKLID